MPKAPLIVREIRARGHKIFLDLKLHDIPNTVKKAMAALSALDVDMVNVHAAGTGAMMSAALAGLTRPDGTRPLLIAVTQLTSTDQDMLEKELWIEKPMAEVVMHYAEIASIVGLDGVVCSPLEAGSDPRALRQELPDRHARRALCRRGCGRPEAGHHPGQGQGAWLRLYRGGPSHHAGCGPRSRLPPLRGGVRGLSCTEENRQNCGYKGEQTMDSINVRVARRLLEIKAVFLRPQEPFTWASGIKSPIYCDNRLILTAPEARNEVEQAIADTVKREYPEAEVLMGTATAGIAHAAIAAHLLGLPMGYVRSGNKDHGRQNRIEGRLDKGEKVVVVEDLISTGGSVLETVEALREAGAEVLGVVSIFTYGMKKGIERMAAAGVKNVSLSNLDTIAQVGAEEGYISQDDVARLLKFRDDPSDESWIHGGKD